MVIAIGIALALFCVAVIAIPILRSRHARELVNPLEMIDELTRRRQLIYQEMAILREGLQVGTLPEAEYQALYQNLRRRAAENLLIQGRWEERLEALDGALEQQVLELREQWRSREGTVTCPECDSTAPASQSNCSACGASLVSSQASALPGGGDGR